MMSFKRGIIGEQESKRRGGEGEGEGVDRVIHKFSIDTEDGGCRLSNTDVKRLNREINY